MSVLATIPSFLAYFGASVGLTLIFLLIYIKATPYDEMVLIRQGLSAPAISLSGALLGFVLALASVIKHSVSFIDMLAWGVVAMIVQLLAFVLVRVFLKTITDGISNNNIAKAILLAAVSVAFGLLNAACMTY